MNTIFPMFLKATKYESFKQLKIHFNNTHSGKAH
jgi:hypothetical protein